LFVDLPADVFHRDPWHGSFAQRLARLRRRSFRVAYFYERPDNSTFRYRVHNMIETIEARWPDASASYFHLDDAAELRTIVDSADVLVICRAKYGSTVSALVAQARRRGIRVFFDVDDLVFDPSYVHLLTSSLAQRMSTEADWDFWFAYVSRIGATLKLCDGAITTNAYLARRLTDFAGVPCAVVPNFMNEAQLARSRDVVEAKRRTGFARDGALHVGYFSGSPTHAKDFEIAASALAAILDRFPSVRVRMVGYLEAPPVLQRHAARLDREAFRDYVNLQGLIGSTEINIAPLQDNRFTNCKSELKYFEAAAVGTVTIASPTFTFAQSIESGRNGYLASAQDWESALARVIGDLDGDLDAYVAMAERGVEDAEARYAWPVQIDAIRAAVTQDLGVSETVRHAAESARAVEGPGAS
jgi:glycosyltransferase involved in cell wall biosynthesis